MALSGRRFDGSVITPELLDELLANYEKPEDLTTEHGLFKQLKKAPIERALGWCSGSRRFCWLREEPTRRC
jgi:hypothetical protein